MNSSGIVVRTWNDAPISRRDSDGFADATAMCQANGKRWNHYQENARTQEYIKALAASTGLAPDQLVVSVKGGPAHLQGTWIHPRLAVDLARWISPAFAVWMDGWFLEALGQQQTRKPWRQRISPFRKEDIDSWLEVGGPVNIPSMLPFIGYPNTRANQMALASELRNRGYIKRRIMHMGRRLVLFYPPAAPQPPALPPSSPAILIRAGSDREAAQAWCDAVEATVSSAIRRRLSPAHRDDSAIPMSSHWRRMPA